MLLFSVHNAEDVPLYPLYVTGAFQDEHFYPRTQGKLVHGGYFYAPQVLRDDQGRYIMWGEGQVVRYLEPGLNLEHMNRHPVVVMH